MPAKKHDYMTGTVLEGTIRDAAIAISQATHSDKKIANAAKRLKTSLATERIVVELPKDATGETWTGEEKEFVYKDETHVLHHIGYDPTATPKTQMWRLFAEDNPENAMVAYVASQCLHTA